MHAYRADKQSLPRAFEVTYFCITECNNLYYRNVNTKFLVTSLGFISAFRKTRYERNTMLERKISSSGLSQNYYDWLRPRDAASCLRRRAVTEGRILIANIVMTYVAIYVEEYFSWICPHFWIIRYLPVTRVDAAQNLLSILIVRRWSGRIFV